MKGRIPLVLALALSLGAGACTMDREQPDQGVPPGDVSRAQDADDIRDLTEASDDPGPGPSEYQTPSPAPVVAQPHPGGGPAVQGALQPVNNYPIGGAVSILSVGGQTQVSVTVNGTRAGSTFQMGLHQGQCGGLGAQVAPLKKEVRVGPEGLVTVIDTIPLPPSTVMNGGHVLVLRPTNASAAVPPVACAPIPAAAR